MGTSMGFLQADGTIAFEDEEESECCIFVDKNSSSHWVPVADPNLLKWSKESATDAFISGQITYEEYHNILNKLLEEDAYNDPSRVKVSYVDVSDTPTNDYSSYLF